MGPALKFCGIRRLEDLTFALKLGVSFVGFNFYQHSKRFVSPIDAAELWHQAKKQVPDGATSPVGVVVDPSIEEITSIIHDFPQIQVIQCHGHDDYENATFLESLRPIIGDRHLWKAVRIGEEADVELASQLAPHVDLILFDTRPDPSTISPKEMGGSGKRFDWFLLKTFRSETRFAIAGGIGPGVIRAASKTGASIVDLCSGIESSPGIKSPDLMKEVYDESL